MLSWLGGKRKRILRTSAHEYTDAASVKCLRRRLNNPQGQLRRRTPLVQRDDQVPFFPPEPHNPIRDDRVPFAWWLNPAATSSATLPPSPDAPHDARSSSIFNSSNSNSPVLGDKGREDVPGCEEALSPLLPSPLGYYCRNTDGERTQSITGRDDRHRDQAPSPLHSFVDSRPLHNFHPSSTHGHQRPPAASNYRHLSFENDMGSPIGSKTSDFLLGGNDKGSWQEDPGDAASTARCPRSPPLPQEPRGALTLDKHQVNPIPHQGSTNHSIGTTAVRHSSSAPLATKCSSRIRSSWDWANPLPTTSSRRPTPTSPGHQQPMPSRARGPMTQHTDNVMHEVAPISRTSLSRHDDLRGAPGRSSLHSGHPLLLIPPRRRPAPFKTAVGRSLDLDCICLDTEEEGDYDGQPF